MEQKDKKERLFHADTLYKMFHKHEIYFTSPSPKKIFLLSVTFIHFGITAPSFLLM